MRIDSSLTLSFSFENASGGQAEVFIPHLDSARFNAAHSVLGKAYTMLKTGSVHPDVFCIDYKEIFKDDMGILNPFLEYHFMSACIISNGVLVDFKETSDTLKAALENAAIDTENLDAAKGLFFFVAAILRYATKSAIGSFGELFKTSQSLQEWKISHESSLKPSATDSGIDKGADRILNI